MPAVNSKRKGKSGELEAAKKLRELGFDDAKRMAQQGAGGGSDNADVIGLPGIHFEIKRKERMGGFELYEALAQSKRDADRSELPAVMYRTSRKPWTVLMDVSDWAVLVHKADAYARIVSEHPELKQ